MDNLPDNKDGLDKPGGPFAPDPEPSFDDGWDEDDDYCGGCGMDTPDCICNEEE